MRIVKQKLTCLILNYNDAATTIKLISNIQSYNILDYILVIDNYSVDNSFKILTEKYRNNPKIIIKRTKKNGGYGFGNNYGIKYAYFKLHSNYVLVTNPDVYFEAPMVEHLLKIAMKNDAALVSGVQRVNNSSIYDKAWKIPTAFEWAVSGTRLGLVYNKKYHYDSNYYNASVVKVDCVPGAMFIVDSQKFINVGGYDEEMFLFGEETLLGFKLKKRNYLTLLATNEYYDHQHSVSINKNIKSQIKQQKILNKSKLIFFKKYQHSNILSLLFYSFIFSIKILKMKIKNKF